MLPTRYLPLVLKYVARRRVRTGLTVGGVATAMFLFYCVQAMHNGVTHATRATPEDAKLIVYQRDRYCPFSSVLPQNYLSRIVSIPGVKSVAPMKVLVNNCRAGLDVVTFRGVPDDAFDRGFFNHVRILEGSIESWKRRSDAALIGSRLANRRRLKLGDRIQLGSIAITVAGILESPEPQDQNVAYTHLEFVQRAADNEVGMVTQFSVRLEDSALSDRVAQAIDDEFRSDQAPTSTWSEKSFVARVATDIIEIVGFARWLGWGCVAGVFALVFNAIVLSVRDRVRDHAVMQTLGYSRRLIAGLVITESVVLSLTGGLAGMLAGAAVLHWGSFSLSVEGLSIHAQAGVWTVVAGLLISCFVGVLAGLVPAFQAASRDLAACFRAV